MTPGTSRQPTLADIAARAGTTVPTVSKVLNGRSDVSEITRNKIMELVAQTGYRRRGTTPVARPSRDRRLIDLVISNVAGGWANQVLVGVESAAAAAGYDLVVTVARPDGTASVRDDWVARLLARSSPGVVLALVDTGIDRLATLQAAGVPVVLLDPVDPPPDSVASVGATNWSAGRDVAEHLLGLGHRRLAVLAGSSRQLYNRARVDGFASAVRLHRDDPASGGQREPTVCHLERQHSAVEEAGRLLDDPQRPTAIFACADYLALAVMQAATARDIAIPQQLSLVGFDDLPEAAWAGLTTVRQPIAEMGAAAMRLLLRLREADRRLPREELATSLIIRDTTAPPAG
ncbi:LacI family DNA-binding transcriptional regulator [Microlunatus elymi]|uniref:LacI family DNA-binding transcriptional regulator n=1 Tax=Microlunatus elymi TaxID=2596828 RepID=UPI001AEF4F0D|nr:LacI family DNA-binding transcriptional regulator [Microlunatus elymi]